MEDVDDLVDQRVAYLHGFLLQVGQRFDLINIDVGMSPAVELIINLKDPLVDVEVAGNQLGQRLVELLLVEDVH